MKINKVLVILLISILLFSSVSPLSADDDRSYTIDDAIINLTVEKSGLLHVDEAYLYSFDGEFNGVYRDIPLKSGERVRNVKVTAEGAYPVLQETDDSGEKRLKIYLYADKAHTRKIKDCKVKIHISYDMENVVTLFNDVGGLQYKLWGDEWDVGVGHVKAVVSMPGDKNNTYYLNPSEYNKTSSMKGDTLTAETTSIPKGEFYELLLLMPLSDFDSDAPYAKHVDKNGREMIEKNLEDSIQSRAMWAMSFIALGLLSLLSPIIAVFVYLRYGREPDVAYEGIYERDLPTEDPPVFINAMMKSRGLGDPDMEGFQATLLDLIDRKVISLDVQAGDFSTKDLILKFERDDLKDLRRHERNLYNMLYSLSDGGVLNMSDLDSKLSSESSGKWFLGELDNFYESAKSEYLTEETVSRYFNDRGSDIMMFLAIGGIVMAAIMLFLGLTTNLKAGIYVLAGGAFLLVFSIALIFLPDDIFGQWTPEGRVFYQEVPAGQQPHQGARS